MWGTGNERKKFWDPSFRTLLTCTSLKDLWIMLLHGYGYAVIPERNLARVRRIVDSSVSKGGGKNEAMKNWGGAGSVGSGKKKNTEGTFSQSNLYLQTHSWVESRIQNLGKRSWVGYELTSRNGLKIPWCTGFLMISIGNFSFVFHCSSVDIFLLSWSNAGVLQ